MGFLRSRPGDGPALSAEAVVPAPYSLTQTVLVLAAALVALGALIHAGAAIDHWSEYHLYTVVFSCLAALQLGWALWIMRGASTRVLLLGCVMQLAIILLWVASRTVGVPLAPSAWTPEQVGVADLVETIAELTTIVAVLVVVFAERSARASRLLGPMPIVLVFMILVSALLGAGAHAG